MHHIATKWLYHELADSCCVWFWNLPHIRLEEGCYGANMPVFRSVPCLSIVAPSVQTPLIIWPKRSAAW
jgi:hypothetical protein